MTSDRSSPGQGGHVGQGRRWSERGFAPTRKRPSHELTGIGRFSHLYSDNGMSGEMATSRGVLALSVTTLLLRAACRWSTAWTYWDLSQSILVHPFSGWPFLHTPHKRLLPESSRIPHHQYALSAPRLPESNCPSELVRRRWLRSLPQHGGTRLHLPLLAPIGLHEGAPYRREGGTVWHLGIRNSHAPVPLGHP
jgi:hypothetical protein